jgi:flagellar assembly protein FliH
MWRSIRPRWKPACDGPRRCSPAPKTRVIRLHPEDLALIGHHLPEDWHCEPDSTLERGAVRVDGAMGGVEDGPAQWRSALDEALRQC